MSALENETTRETTEFDHFDRKWHVPSAIRLSHRERFSDEFRATGNANVAMCRAYLPTDEMKALREVDPTDAEIDAFTDSMADALGFGNAGNS